MPLGQLIDGQWTDADTLRDGTGAFVRTASAFGARVTEAASGGSHPLEAGRYRLIVSLACPWSHRTVLARALLGLGEAVPMTNVDPVIGPEGWVVHADDDAWPARGVTRLHQLYTATDPTFTGRVTVPVLWDERLGRLVSNDSAAIMRMFEEVFRPLGAEDAPVLVPDVLRDEIEALNDRIYRELANAAYRAGFATAQAPYEEAVSQVFRTLDGLETLLASRRYLLGSDPTEADWRLFPTLVRFDAVYHQHFKCNRRRLVDYPALWAYARDLYARPGVAETVDFDDIRRSYYLSQRDINPSGVIPIGPELDWGAPHGRERLA